MTFAYPFKLLRVNWTLAQTLFNAQCPASEAPAPSRASDLRAGIRRLPALARELSPVRV